MQKGVNLQEAIHFHGVFHWEKSVRLTARADLSRWDQAVRQPNGSAWQTIDIALINALRQRALIFFGQASGEYLDFSSR